MSIRSSDFSDIGSSSLAPSGLGHSCTFSQNILNNFGITHLELNVALCGTAQRHEHGWKPPVMNTYGESEREGESKGGVEDLHFITASNFWRSVFCLALLSCVTVKFYRKKAPRSRWPRRHLGHSEAAARRAGATNEAWGSLGQARPTTTDRPRSRTSFEHAEGRRGAPW